MGRYEKDGCLCPDSQTEAYRRSANIEFYLHRFRDKASRWPIQPEGGHEKDGGTRRLQAIVQNDEHEWKFITLLSLQNVSTNYDEIVEARYLVTLAEAVLTVWLAALGNGKMPRFRALCP